MIVVAVAAVPVTVVISDRNIYCCCSDGSASFDINADV